jgi:hypothetical protein
MDVIIFENQSALERAVSFAEHLGEKEIIVLFEKDVKEGKGIVRALQTSITLKTALLVHDHKEAMRHKGNYDYLFGIATRELLETGLISFAFGAETLEEKDKNNRRGSGINQVIAHIIYENKVTYLYDMRLLFSADTTLIIGRMAQNKKILSKYDCSQELCSFARKQLELRAPKERKHFISLL